MAIHIATCLRCRTRSILDVYCRQAPSYVSRRGLALQTHVSSKASDMKPVARVSDHPMLVAGELVQASSGLSAPVVNPATGEIFDYVPHATREDMDWAVTAATKAFSTWSAMPFQERAGCLLHFGEMVKAKEHELARALTMEQGKPLAMALAEVRRVPAACRDCAEIGDLQSETVTEDRTAEYKLVYMPRGVVGGITPWNFPLAMASMKVLPSTIVGNTCILKPSPYTPLATVMLAQLAKDAFPPGVVNILTGGDELGQLMVEHPKIAQISFTGSVATGKKIMAACAGSLKKLTLELGGNDPAIVLPDVDVAQVAPRIFEGAMRNTGQVCVAIKRVFVHESKYEEMVEALRKLAEKAKTTMNDGLMKGTKLGPVNNKMQLERVAELVEDAKGSGARVVAGGQPFNPNGKSGFFYEPTVLADVHEGVRIVDEEQFGPVIPLLKYSDIDNAIFRANDTDFGLGGSIWTNDLELGAKLAVRLEAGIKGVNAHPGSHEAMPFGGVKQSGIGRERGGTIGLKEFVDIATLRVAKVGFQS